MSAIQINKEEPKSSNETHKRLSEFVADNMDTQPAQASAREIECLNSLLANEFSVFTKTLNFHWNITGPRFNSMHTLLGDQYNELLKMIDDIAERIREVGGRAIGTLKELKGSSSVVERPGVYPSSNIMLGELLADHESLQIQIKAILHDLEQTGDDPGTVDFLTSILKKHEEMGWVLKSHLD